MNYEDIIAVLEWEDKCDVIRRERMRRTNYGMLTANDENNENEKALDYIRELKIELDGTDILNSGIPINNQFICDMFFQFFEKYQPTIVDIAKFMKQVKESSIEENKEQ